MPGRIPVPVVYTRGAAAAGLLTVVLFLLVYFVAPAFVRDAGEVTFAGLCLALGSASLEVSGVPARLYFIPTWVLGGVMFLFGLLRAPSLTALLGLAAAALVFAGVWYLAARARLARLDAEAGRNLSLLPAARDPFEAVERACGSILPLRELSLEKREAYRAALGRVLTLAGGDLSATQRTTLQAFERELAEVGNPDRRDDGVMERALAVLGEVRVRAAEGRLNPDLAAWKAMHEGGGARVPRAWSGEAASRPPDGDASRPVDGPPDATG